MSILLELFDRKVEWEPLLNQREAFSAQFIINELTYEVHLDGQWAADIKLHDPEEEFRDAWDVHFSVSGTADADYYSHDGITGTGNAILVFSTVIEIINHAIESKNIQTLVFGANNKEPTRVKLYNRMAAYFAKNGWRYIDDREIHKRRPDTILELDRAVVYILTKHPRPVTESILLELFDKHAD